MSVVEYGNEWNSLKYGVWYVGRMHSVAAVCVFDCVEVVNKLYLACFCVVVMCRK